MHQHHLEFSAQVTDDRGEKLRYFGFTAVVGVLLLLNLLGVWKTIFGLDTAALLAVIAGYRTFYNAISGLLDKKITADLAICIAVVAALAIGAYLAAAEAMFIMLIGEGLEGYAAQRTSKAITRFVEQMPRQATLLRGGETPALVSREEARKPSRDYINTEDLILLVDDEEGPGTDLS